MFTNIEGKLKGLAEVNFACGILGGVAWVIILWPMTILSITVGLTCLLIGLFSSWLIYAFAELLESIKEINKTLKQTNQTQKFEHAQNDIAKNPQTEQLKTEAQPKAAAQKVQAKRVQVLQQAPIPQKEKTPEEIAKWARVGAYWEKHPEEQKALAQKRISAAEKLEDSEISEAQRKELEDLIRSIDEELFRDRDE